MCLSTCNVRGTPQHMRVPSWGTMVVPRPHRHLLYLPHLNILDFLILLSRPLRVAYSPMRSKLAGTYLVTTEYRTSAGVSCKHRSVTISSRRMKVNFAADRPGYMLPYTGWKWSTSECDQASNDISDLILVARVHRCWSVADISPVHACSINCPVCV
jgi:hypothetical protein